MKRVMVFGTFDLLHEGHRSFLKSAADYGELTVVVARDANVNRIKGRKPVQDESARRARVGGLPFVNEAVLGGMDNLLEIIDKTSPDIICLGYDQADQGLLKHLKKVKMHVKIMRLRAYRPEKFKSTVIRADIPETRSTD